MSAPSLLDGPTKRTDWKRSRRVPLNEQGQQRQHFLLSAAAVTLSEKQVARMTEAEAYSALEAIRFAEQGGNPFCPYCNTTGAYRMTINRRTKAGIKPTVLYKCRHSECRKQFSITSGTTLSGRKMRHYGVNAPNHVGTPPLSRRPPTVGSWDAQQPLSHSNASTPGS